MRKRPEPWMCSISASMGSAIQAISRPRSAAWASGRVSISWRVNQGRLGTRPSGAWYSGTLKPAEGTREASYTGS
ncbi:hypothetical protein D3C72_1022250 [compost metagenome]